MNNNPIHSNEISQDNLERSERDLTDESISIQRQEVDRAIQTQRDGNSVSDHLDDLIKRERDETDRRFKDERQIADDDATRSSQILNEEQASHMKTRADLTTRDEFLAIVSHDLRNPIGTVSSCAEMLLEDLDYQGIGSEMKNWITLIKRNADSALNLIRDLLDMERLSQGQLYLELKLLDLTKLLRESVDDFVQDASARGVLLRFIPSHKVEEIICDRDRIKQIISNLIGNALKFTPEGGSIVIRTAVKESVLTISVTDTGIGIPLAKQKYLFQRFSQLGSKDRRGLGLGLYISKMLTEAHGGSIHVFSELGRGSTFEVSIPIRPS